MQVTRRFWATISLAAVLLAGAWILDIAFLLVGAAAVSASLVAQQLVFVFGVARLPDDFDVSQSVGRDELTVGSDLAVVLRVELPYPSPFPLSVTASPPIAATGSSDADRTATVDAGEANATTDFSLQFPVAGEYRFSAPSVTVRDPLDVFETTLRFGTTPEITVAPGTPSDTHVGIRGERVMTSLGTTKTGYQGTGFDPAEIREFVPGDTMRHIDWKTTARMNDLYVREFEEKTDISNVIVMDHRSPMAVGKQGRTKLDYARQVALGFVTNGEVTETPYGLYGVGNGGVSVQRLPRSTHQHYDHLRTELRELSATTASVPEGRIPQTSPEFTTHTDARAAVKRLQSGSPFDRRLRPFFESRTSVTTELGDKPLLDAIRGHRVNVRETVIAVLFTDDTRRAELREFIKLANRRYERVIVFLTPVVLFETADLADLAQAYERYVEFEEFRQSLSEPNVIVYEVGPQDRLRTILSSHNRRQRQGVSG